MNKLVAYLIAGCVALGVALGATGNALLHKCPSAQTVTIADTLRVSSAACTVVVHDRQTVVRRVVVTERDTVWMHAPTDSLSVAVFDTTMADGALIGVRTEAVLIVPPTRSTVTYTPAPRVERTIHVPVVEYRTDWRWVTIGALAGIATGLTIDKVAGK